MAKIKVQFVAGREIVTDLRGDKFVGKEQGDHHRTIAQIVDPPEEMIALVLAEAPKLNAAAEGMFDLLEKIGLPKDKILDGLGIIMGEDVDDAEYAAVQIRVYDN